MASSGQWKTVTHNWSSQGQRSLCVNGTPWILYLLEECVENTWEYLSVVVGLVSMTCFLLSTIPQVYEAYRSGRVEEAMSFGFLFCLFSGDVTSFAGGYLTRQLPIQIVAVISYIVTDLVLISQFIYYKIKNGSSTKRPVLKWMCLLWCGAGTLVLLSLPRLLIDVHAEVGQKILLFHLRSSVSSCSQGTTSSRSMEISGYICGYVSSIFYLLSRLPQLYKNFQRRSTEGTSYFLFALAMMGNTTYGLSVVLVLPALRSSRRTFVIKHLAWLISSVGVLILDLFITLQFIIYKKNSSKALVRVTEQEPLLCDEEDSSVL